jgi:hypothetical protein
VIPFLAPARPIAYISPMRLLALALLVACGGKAVPVDKPVDKPAVVDDSPPCAPAGPIALPPDGKLRCRELPFEVTFPTIKDLIRQDERTLTLYSAKLERGAMLIVVEPRSDTPDPARITQLLENLVKTIIPDATLAPAEAPAIANATASAAATFTTTEGGAGIARGYFANHFVIAMVVGASKPDAISRPEKPAAQQFLSSLTVKPLPTGARRYELANGGHVELPASAWPTMRPPISDGVRSEVIHLVPERGVWVGVRELEQKDRCEYLKGAVAGPQDDIADRLKSIYSNADNPLSKIERGKHGDISVYAEAESGPTRVTMYLICAAKTAVQLTVAGEKPHAELRPQLDEVAKTLVGAK